MLLVLLGIELDLALMDLYMAIDLRMDLELVLNLLMDRREKLLLVAVNLDKLLRLALVLGQVLLPLLLVHLTIDLEHPVLHPDHKHLTHELQVLLQVVLKLLLNQRLHQLDQLTQGKGSNLDQPDQRLLLEHLLD